MMMIKINDHIIDRFLADSSEYQLTFDVPLLENNQLKIEHYGKNYITDHTPDKYFELKKVFVNEVDLKHHIYHFKQTAFLPPWDHQPPPEHSFYLGHNGFLALNFTSPVNDWIQRLFNLTTETMHGQQTTRKVLYQVKEFFNIP
jgi:hypothetical protein